MVHWENHWCVSDLQFGMTRNWSGTWSLKELCIRQAAVLQSHSLKKKNLKVVRDLKLLPSAESGGLQALCSHILFPKRLYSGYSRSRALGTTNGVYMTWSWQVCLVHVVIVIPSSTTISSATLPQCPNKSWLSCLCHFNPAHWQIRYRGSSVHRPSALETMTAHS